MGWLRPGHTRPFRGPDSNVLLNSVAEIKYVRLGGIDQWVMIWILVLITTLVSPRMWFER